MNDDSILTIARMDAGRVADFDALHCGDASWCQCAAWWVPTWDGWGERRAADNRAVREALWARGEYDGYLLYADGAPAGWCQVGPRDRLAKLVAQFALPPAPRTWAITCFLIAPTARRQGLATRLLRAVLDDLPARGATRVEAFPKRGADPDTLDLWNGPEALFRRAGFHVVRDDPRRPVLALDLPGPQAP
jgi:GNAT superfamily N-acetyltransferase